MDLKCVRAIFQVVRFLVCFPGEFPRFSEWNDGGIQSFRHGRSKKEATGFNRGNVSWAKMADCLSQPFNGDPECFGRSKEGRDVLENNPGLWEVRNIAEVILQA
jgi:hypothetical protein